MQSCFYKKQYVIPAIHERGPRNYYATFCIDNGRTRKPKCFTVRPNFKTSGEAREAAYKAGRAKVDELLKLSAWKNFIRKLKPIQNREKSERRSKNTVYYNY